jgi:hypothetical protein
VAISDILSHAMNTRVIKKAQFSRKGKISLITTTLASSEKNNRQKSNYAMQK